ncbi:MAG: SDR family NAD(P)-dependent oxidoreductase, partial [Spirochaetota bacterium]
MSLNNNGSAGAADAQAEKCISYLESLLENPGQMAELSEERRIALISAAGKLSRPKKDEFRKRGREIKKTKQKAGDLHNREARAATGIRSARQSAVFSAPSQIAYSPEPGEQSVKELNSPRNCYVCKAEYTKLHFFYDAMCPACAEFNYQKRFQSADLRGQTALITGSRLKIGYHASLMLLRAGARVIATTRFPVDSAMRFSAEKDFADWGDRLQIYGLDLRHTPSVEIFCTMIEQKYDRLDILINNAAQTVRRPPGFYSHLMENELKPLSALDGKTLSLLHHHHECIGRLSAFSREHSEDGLVAWDGKMPGLGLRASAQLSQIPYSHDHTPDMQTAFPVGKL